MSKKLGGSYRKLFAASTISNLGDGIGQIAYPWLASAVTRNPLLVALVTVVQRLPWLLFSLPAGVITDRYERRSLMVLANTARTILTLGVAAMVLNQSDSLPGPGELDDVDLAIDTNILLYGVVIGATLLLGTAEVLYDNTAQTFMPSIVDEDQLEKANGRLWSAEQVTNTFAGPALGAALLAFAFAVPFFVDALTFALSALLIFLLPRPTATPKSGAEQKPWKEELAKDSGGCGATSCFARLRSFSGCSTCWARWRSRRSCSMAKRCWTPHRPSSRSCRPAARSEGIAGGWAASTVSARLGPGPSLWMTLIVGGLTSIITGLTSLWPVAWVMQAFFMFSAVVWNVITVSLRQAIIPDRLLGRVNSVYRFFAWGMMPIGALVGGVMIVIGETAGSRDFALRLPWLVSGALQFALLAFAAPRLTTAKIERARAGADTSV